MSAAVPQGPAKPAEAEEKAVRLVSEYLTACRMTDQAQVADYLMKLCSVAGVVMARVNGSEDAAQRLEGTAVFIRQNMPPRPTPLVPVQ